MTPSVVFHAVRQGSQNVAVAVAVAVTGHNDRCFPQYAPSVAKKPRCHSNRMKIDLCIVATAIVVLSNKDNEISGPEYM